VHIHSSLTNATGNPNIGNDGVSAAEEAQKNRKKPLRNIFYSVGYIDWHDPEEQQPFREAVKAAKDSITWSDFSKTWTSYNVEYQRATVANFKRSLLSNLKYINLLPHI
jgi:hypothetical protein